MSIALSEDQVIVGMSNGGDNMANYVKVSQPSPTQPWKNSWKFDNEAIMNTE